MRTGRFECVILGGVVVAALVVLMVMDHLREPLKRDGYGETKTLLKKAGGIAVVPFVWMVMPLAVAITRLRPPHWGVGAEMWEWERAAFRGQSDLWLITFTPLGWLG